MLDSEEIRVVYLAGLFGYMLDEKNFIDVGIKDEIEIVRDNLEKIIKNRVSIEDAKLQKIHNKVKKGKLKIVVTSSEKLENDRRKALNSQTNVNREALFNVCEISMHATCKNCERNRSKCNLRKSLLKCNIPWVNDGKGKCQYNILAE